MKKFQFSLDKLKDYKGQVLEREKNDLARLRREHQEILDKIEALKAELEKSNEEFREQTVRGMNASRVQFYKNYHFSLTEQIKQQEEEAAKAELRVQKQLNVVIDATKEVSSLEKLEEKQLDEYKFKSAKEEENFVAEYVTNSTYR